MKKQCSLLGSNEQQKKLGLILSRAKKDALSVVQILKAVQDIFGFLPESVLEHVAISLGIPLSELFGVASFYTFFRFKPVGKHVVSVCTGTACFVKGAQKILDQLCMLLKIQPGETSADGLFSLTQTRCIGCCGLAPVVTVDSEVFSKVSLSDLPGILKKFREENK